MAKRKIKPEPFPKEYTGYPFLTLVTFETFNWLMVISNVDSSNISGYVVDLCPPSKVDEEQLIDAAYEYYKSDSTMPFAIFLSSHNISSYFSPIFRTIPLDGVKRVIGNGEHFKPDKHKIKVKRFRRRLPKDT